MTRRNGKLLHSGKLHRSRIDDIELCRAVQERFLQLCKLHLTATGEELPIPGSLDRDFLRWRAMAVRHKRGDFRHTEAELRSVKAVAQWTVDEKAKLQGREPEKIEWEH